MGSGQDPVSDHGTGSIPLQLWVGGYAALLLLLYGTARVAFSGALYGGDLSKLDPKLDAVRKLAAISKVASSRLVSFTNALLVTGTAAIYLALERRERAALPDAAARLLGADDGPPLGELAEFSILLMLGYIVADCTVAAVVGLDHGGGLMMAHHALGTVSELLTLWSGYGGYCTMAVHLAEGSTPLLHLSWLCVKMGWDTAADGKRTKLFTAIGAGLVLSFFALRVAAPAALLYYALGQRGREAWDYGRSCAVDAEGPPSPVALPWPFPAGAIVVGKSKCEFQDRLYIFQMGTIIAWWALNLYWFYLLVLTATGKRKVDSSDPHLDKKKTA